MFLGAVVARTTAAQEAPMSAEFSLLAARYARLMSFYQSGEINGEQLAAQLAEERVWDTDGGEWTIGASSGAWYRRVAGEGWTQVPPPGPHVQAVVRLVAEQEPEQESNAPVDPFATLYATPAQAEAEELTVAPSFDGVVELYPSEPSVAAPSSPSPGGGDEAVADPYVTDERGTALPEAPGDVHELARRWLDS
jgi:hypothetical protein